MEANGCGGKIMLFKLYFPKNKVDLPKLHMNRYLGPSSISISISSVSSIHRYRQFINDSPTGYQVSG